MDHKHIYIDNNSNFDRNLLWNYLNFVNTIGNYQNLDNSQINQLNLLIPIYQQYIANSLLYGNNVPVSNYSSGQSMDYTNILSKYLLQNMNYNDYQFDPTISSCISNVKIDSPNCIYKSMETNNYPATDIKIGNNSCGIIKDMQYPINLSDNYGLHNLYSMNNYLSPDQHTNNARCNGNQLDNGSINSSLIGADNSALINNNTIFFVGNNSPTDTTPSVGSINNTNAKNIANNVNNVDMNDILSNLKEEKSCGNINSPTTLAINQKPSIINGNYNDADKFIQNSVNDENIKPEALKNQTPNPEHSKLLSISVKNDDNFRKNDLIIKKFTSIPGNSNVQGRKEIKHHTRGVVSKRTKPKPCSGSNNRNKHFIDRDIIDTGNISNLTSQNGPHLATDKNDSDDNSTKRYKCRRCYKHGLVVLVRHHICPYKVYTKSDIHNLLFRKDRENGLYKRNIKLRRATVASGKLSKYCCKRCPGVLKKGHKCPYKLC